MDLKRIIKFFYLIYTIYMILVVNITNLTFFIIFPAIIFMWANYLSFSIGYGIYKEKKILVNDANNSNSEFLNRNIFLLIVIAFLSLLFSIAVVRFYTGQTPISIFKNLENNISLYHEYQFYFYEQQRNIFSLAKIPFILMLFYIKLTLFYSLISFLIIKEKTTKFEKLYLMLVTLSYIYVGLARGTNFEFFELLMVIIFIIFTKYKNMKKFKMQFKTLLIIFFLISLMIFVFYIRMSSRGVIFNIYISKDIQYDPNGLISLLPPFIISIILRIFSYFGFGFFYISIYITEVWLLSINNFLKGFFSLGSYDNGVDNLHDIMKNLIDMGSRWKPDASLIINSIGYLGLLIFCFVIGIFTKYIYNTIEKNTVTYLTGFIILLQMISLPIGNFISTSSASILIVFLLIVFWIKKLFIKVKK